MEDAILFSKIKLVVLAFRGFDFLIFFLFIKNPTVLSLSDKFLL